LNYHLSEEKTYGKVKGQGCADGRKQKLYLNKEDFSLPAVSIEVILLSYVMDAELGRDVATFDIPGAFMQADRNKVLHMWLEGHMAEI
jgi:hypothetical protein